jgi:hypothetical protein
MRHSTVLMSALLAGFFVAGCKPESNPATEAKLARAKEEIKKAAEATAEAASAKKDEYVCEMNKQLEALNVKMADLKERASRAAGETKKDLEKKLEEAKAKHSTVSTKLEELKDASADRWEKLKEGLSNAVGDLKKVIE